MPLLLFIILSSTSAKALPEAILNERISSAATRWSLDVRLVKAVIHQESRANTMAKSSKGAEGLMQVMPRTADEYGIRDRRNPLDNLMGACKYLRLLMNRYRGNLPLVLAAYNAGPKSVDRYGGIPPFAETQNYVRKVLSHYQKLKLASGP